MKKDTLVNIDGVVKTAAEWEESSEMATSTQEVVVATSPEIEVEETPKVVRKAKKAKK